MPEMLLTLFACAALALDVILPKPLKRVVAYFSLSGIVLTAFSLWQLYASFHNHFPRSAFFDMFVVDQFAVVFKFIFLIVAAVAVLISIRYLDIEQEQRGEYYSLILFATTGMMCISSGADLLTLFVSLELMAISVYVLVGFLKRDRKSNEASMKYFLLGAFSTGILLYGMSLIYGAAGTTNLRAIAGALPGLMSDANGPRMIILLAMVLMATGLFFKIAAVPFHMWAPDAYEGAPTSITAFMSVGPKAAAYALFARIFLTALGPLYGEWVTLFGVVAALTMTVGNVSAVTQDNSKRLLAYSSIAHAGYILLGIVAGNRMGYSGIVFYLMAYAMMNLGAFSIIIALRREGIIGDHVDDLNGLSKSHPYVTAAMTIFMLSLAGIPFTAGFFGKFLLFGGLIQTGDKWMITLAIIAVVNTAISLYYYARFIKAMFIGEATSEQQIPLSLSAPLKTCVAVAAILTVLLGVYPQPFASISGRAFTSFGELTGYLTKTAPPSDDEPGLSPLR